MAPFESRRQTMNPIKLGTPVRNILGWWNRRYQSLNPWELLLVAVVLTMILLSLGCQTHDGVPPDMYLAAPPPSTTRLSGYRIEPHDQLDIKFFYSPDLNESVTVRPDGKISLQLVGAIQASGLSPEQLQAQLEAEYSKHLRAPQIAVILRTFTGEQVFVDGEVNQPGMVELLPGLSAWQAIIRAGGFKDTATREDVLVIRMDASNKPTPYRVDLGSESLDHNRSLMGLRPHDVIFVPKTAIAEADKFSNQYIEKLLLFKGWYFNLSPIGPLTN